MDGHGIKKIQVRSYEHAFGIIRPRCRTHPQQTLAGAARPDQTIWVQHSATVSILLLSYSKLVTLRSFAILPLPLLKGGGGQNGKASSKKNRALSICACRQSCSKFRPSCQYHISAILAGRLSERTNQHLRPLSIQWTWLTSTGKLKKSFALPTIN